MPLTMRTRHSAGLRATIEVKDDGGEDSAPVFTARITTDVVDREREVLLPAGMITGDFKRNPVVFWNHNYDEPIGRCLKLEKRDRDWLAMAQLSKTNARARDVHGLMKEDIVKGVSVGFIPIEGRNATPKDMETFGSEVQYVYNKWKLLEFSVTPLPANPEALVTSVSKMVNKGMMTPRRARELCGVDVDVSCAGNGPGVRRRKVLIVVEKREKRKRVSPKAMQAKINDQVDRAVAKKLGFNSVEAYLEKCGRIVV